MHSVYSTIAMECFHGRPAASSRTVRGTFWFCGETPSCEFFCHDKDCYLFTRTMEACQNSGSNHPICPTHQILAKLDVVKDKMKDNYGRPFFTCSDRHDTYNFWQWGDIYETPRSCCKHGMVTHQEPPVLLLPSDRQLWIFRMEIDRASCDEDWLRPVQLSATISTQE
jgi:hypothetical protein